MSSIEWYHFPVADAMCAMVTLVLIFYNTNFKCKHAPLVLHRFERHKYLREDHSTGGITFQQLHKVIPENELFLLITRNHFTRVHDMW